MATKSYTIPYDPRTETWETVVVSAQARSKGDGDVQRLTPEVLVEDAPDTEYPALENGLLLLDQVEVEGGMDGGDVAKIHARLDDGNAQLLDVLNQHSHFRVQVTVRPELSEEGADGSRPGPPVEGIVSVHAQLPQTWDLTFRKTLWEDGGVIDLTTLDEVPQAQLRELGDSGGRLILQPQGRFLDEDSGEEIVSAKTVAHARTCVLDRGDGDWISGEWSPDEDGYVFEIEPGQAEEGADPAAAKELVVGPYIPLYQGWQRQLSTLLSSARVIGESLAPDIPQSARRYIEDCLNYLATRSDEYLAERRKDLNVWILNTSHFIEFVGDATEMFNKALELMETAHGRFVDNMVNFGVELTFSLFDVLDLVFKSSSPTVKAALKGSTREMVEEVSERTARELLQKREVVEQAADRSREVLRDLDIRIGAARALRPADISDPTPAVRRQLDEFVEEAAKLQRQRKEAYEQFVRQKRELADLEANLAIARQIRENAGQATEKEFLESIRQQALDLPDTPEIREIIREVEQITSRDVSLYLEWKGQVAEMLSELPAHAPEETRASLERLASALSQGIREEALFDFANNPIEDILGKGPLGERLKEVNQRAQEGKEAAERIRYQNVAWEHYKGFFSPVWWFMDWSIAQILWLHDLALEWIPGLAQAESLLAACVDTVLYYAMAIINWSIDTMNSYQFRRSRIDREMRPMVQAVAYGYGIHSRFFHFPSETAKIPEMVKPRRVVGMAQNGSPAQMEAVKQRILRQAAGGYRHEADVQRNQARRLFTNLCRNVLRPGRLDQAAPQHIGAATMRDVWPRLAGPMVKYEAAFNRAAETGTDYLATGTDHLWTIGGFDEESTFQDLDGAIEWLAWAVAWGLRIGGVLAVFTGVGVAALPAMFLFAQGAEQIGAVLRPLVSWLGTMPDVIAFQCDVVLAAAAAYDATTGGDIDLDKLVGTSECVTWDDLSTEILTG
ncbi:MAG: hypothetical protein ACOC7Y_01045 [Chloroflexota bacterium]